VPVTANGHHIKRFTRSLHHDDFIFGKPQSQNASKYLGWVS